MKYALFFLLYLSSLCTAHDSLEKVSLQLQWLDQFQFAGYYMAKEKGFYREAGFDVEIKKFTTRTDVVGDVISQKSTYGIGRSSLIWHYSKGKEVSLLSATFQSSPLVLIALESSKIEDIKDFVGKTAMIVEEKIEIASIYAMINSAKIDEKSMKFKKHTSDLEELIDGRVDLYTGYISNEPLILKERGIPYRLFYPKEKGFDFYSDILFTSQAESDQNPQRVEKFTRASAKGWEYAFANMEEAVDIIYEKYNSANKTKSALMFEATELKKLAYANKVPFGTIDKNKIERILDVYRIIGLIQGNIDLERLIFDYRKKVLSEEEKDYLRQKGKINVCAIASMLPFSDFKDGVFVGIGSDILKLTKENVDISYGYVKSQSWEDALQKIAERKCDVLPVAIERHEEKNIKYTQEYRHEPLVVVTKKTQNYIADIGNALDKEFAVVKGAPFIEELRKRNREIKLNYVDSLKEGLDVVETGKYYGYIDTLTATAYAFQNISNGHLKISGRFEDKVNICFGVRDDDKILFNIFEKFSKDLQYANIHDIFNSRVFVNYVKDVKIKYLEEAGGAVFLLLLVFFYRQHILKKKNRELEALKEELELKIARAVSDIQKKDTYMLHKSRLAQMGEMISMVAHQWKQPLGTVSALQISVLMAIELEEYDLADAKKREMFLSFLEEKLTKIGSQTQALSTIISDFSDFYKPNKQQEEVCLNTLIAKAYKLLEDDLLLENIDLCLELDSKKSVLLFKNEFLQALLSIINNAREQLKEKNIKDAQILIKSYERGDVSVIEISDNALGIAEDIIEKIFDPYFSTKFDKNGTGLGLHMSKSIIEQHYKGRIYAQNIQNGAKFTIEIGRGVKDEK